MRLGAWGLSDSADTVSCMAIEAYGETQAAQKREKGCELAVAEYLQLAPSFQANQCTLSARDFAGW